MRAALLRVESERFNSLRWCVLERERERERESQADLKVKICKLCAWRQQQ